MMGALSLYARLVLVALYTLPLMPVQWLALRFGWPDERIIPRLWHRMTLWVLGIRVRKFGKPALNGPLMMAANHVSWTDIVVLGSISGVHFIAKSDMASWPILGTFARMQRSVFVERERKRSSSDQAQEIAERLSGGDPMVLFAEGTTGDGNGVLPFKTTLFGAAQLALQTLDDQHVTIQPVALAYTKSHGMKLNRRERAQISWIGDLDLWPHLKTVLKARPLEVEVRFGEPLSFAGAGDRKTVAREAERQVRAMLRRALRGHDTAQH